MSRMPLVSAILLLVASIASGASITGSMTVNGKKTEFHHVIAVAAPSMFHPNDRQDLIIVFSDTPVTASEVLDSKLTSRWMNGKLSALLLRIEPWDKQVVSGNLWAGNLASKGQQISGNGMADFTFKTFDTKRVAGRATQKDYGKDPTLQVDATFDAPIEGGTLNFSAPASEMPSAAPKLNGKPLPANGGEPGAAYLAFVKAVQSGNTAGIRKYLGKVLNGGSDAELKDVLPMLKEMAPKDSKVTGGVANDREAEVAFTSASGAGTAKMVREKDGWKFNGIRPH